MCQLPIGRFADKVALLFGAVVIVAAAGATAVRGDRDAVALALGLMTFGKVFALSSRPSRTERHA